MVGIKLGGLYAKNHFKSIGRLVNHRMYCVLPKVNYTLQSTTMIVIDLSFAGNMKQLHVI